MFQFFLRLDGSTFDAINSLAGKSVAVEAATTEKAKLDAQNKILAGAK